ncbi:FAD-dependent monooxygenase [Candidatus Berkiella aquae]|nr:FAD-dependent monooxygenase [Candidatus Berkiella aquae]MCS5711520.1 FAD-dependent monooxygenase [Candidatus Berkiella aquae]
MQMQTPVLIVGAGPTGLTAALNLRQQGIDCLIIDKKSEPTKTSNALALQSRTLENLEKLGIVETLLSQGHQINGLKIHNENAQIGQIELNNLPTKYPFIIGLPQSDTEKVLLDKLNTHQVQVLRGTELIDFKQVDDKIEITCKNTEQQTIQISAKWLLGCDGSHSRIREKLQIPFLGQDLSKHFIMADIPRNDHYTLAYDYANGFLSPQGTMVIIPLKSFYRIIIDVSEIPDLNNEKNPSLEVFQQLSQKICPYPLGLDNMLWGSGFWIHEHVVTAYHRTNIFLLGDAAHEHSPMGGQGMNTGIQDAINLTWKLALVEKNLLKREVLPSYQEERLPVAKNVVSKTTIATHVITLKSRWLITIRNHIMKFLLHKKSILNKITQTVSELKINYMGSSYVGESDSWSAGIKPGDRVPSIFQAYLDPNQFTLLVFVDVTAKETAAQFIKEISNNHPDLLKIVVISSENLQVQATEEAHDQGEQLKTLMGIKQSGFYLARPDTYVAYRSQTLNHDAFKACCEKVGIKTPS